jgi:DNA end-binding protein Ku
MARAIWSGAVSFGLVNVPLKAYSALHDHRVHFHQLEKKTGARVRYRKVSDKTDKEINSDDIELGYEISKGHYVVVDPDEIESLRPRTTRSIDVNDFVALDDIDPIYYDHTYWLAPDGEAAERPYRLLLAAMEDQQRVGIGTVVMHNKQYLAAVRPLDGALALSTMRFADEVVPKSDVDQLPDRRAKPAAKELKLATQIISSLATEWDPGRYHDTYTDELHDLIARKAKGEEIVAGAKSEERPNVVDLMAALEASVKDAKASRTRPARARPARARRSTKKASSPKPSSRKSA